MESSGSSKNNHLRSLYHPVERQFINILKKVQNNKEKNTLKTYGFEMVFYWISRFKILNMRNIRKKHIDSYYCFLHENEKEDYYIRGSFVAANLIHRNIPNAKYSLNYSKDFLHGLGITELMIDSEKVWVDMKLPTNEKGEFLCTYCQSTIIFLNMSYPQWKCLKCNSSVGVHKQTKIPLGTTANEETKKYRILAHTYFDSLVKRKMIKEGCSKFVARTKGYLWLSNCLNLESAQCHIGLMDSEACQRVINICKPYLD